MKLQLGQEFIVLGLHHYERAKVIAIDKKVYTLDNNVKIDSNLQPLNTNKVKVELFDQDKWDLLVAKGELPKLIAELNTKIFTDEQVMYTHKKLKKLLSKLQNVKA